MIYVRCSPEVVQDLLFCRASVFKSLGDVTMAIVNYTQAIKLQPSDSEAYQQRAEMYEQVRIYNSYKIKTGVLCQMHRLVYIE